jgi:hypothetical protein
MPSLLLRTGVTGQPTRDNSRAITARHSAYADNLTADGTPNIGPAESEGAQYTYKIQPKYQSCRYGRDSVH